MKSIKQSLSVALLVGFSIGLVSCGDDDGAGLQANSELLVGKWDAQSTEYFECPDPSENKTEPCPGDLYCLNYEFFDDGSVKVYNTAGLQLDQGTYAFTSGELDLNLDSFRGGGFELLNNDTFVLYSFTTHSEDCRTKLTYARAS